MTTEKKEYSHEEIAASVRKALFEASGNEKYLKNWLLRNFFAYAITASHLIQIPSNYGVVIKEYFRTERLVTRVEDGPDPRSRDRWCFVFLDYDPERDYQCLMHYLKYQVFKPWEF